MSRQDGCVSRFLVFFYRKKSTLSGADNQVVLTGCRLFGGSQYRLFVYVEAGSVPGSAHCGEDGEEQWFFTVKPC